MFTRDFWDEGVHAPVNRGYVVERGPCAVHVQSHEVLYIVILQLRKRGSPS